MLNAAGTGRAASPSDRPNSLAGLAARAEVPAALAHGPSDWQGAHTQVLHCLPQPALMVDHTLSLLAANAAAWRLLGAGSTLMTRDGRMRCVNSDLQSRLVAAVKALLSAPLGSGPLPPTPPSGVLRLSSLQDSGCRLILQLFALHQAGPAPGRATTGVALVLVHDLDARPSPDPAAVVQAFDLTPGEWRVARQLATGASAQRIARDHGVALSTVRSQIRTLFDKVGVKRQAELVATLAALPARV
jgi:DNA-binding CsgD family transcriptional regulator